jgi:hypothetical protein
MHVLRWEFRHAAIRLPTTIIHVQHQLCSRRSQVAEAAVTSASACCLRAPCVTGAEAKRLSIRPDAFIIVDGSLPSIGRPAAGPAQ